MTDGRWIERPEELELLTLVDSGLDSFSVLLGPPGSGKSALLARIANGLKERGARMLALKADRIPIEISTLSALDGWLGLAQSLPNAIRQLSATRPVVLLIDQIDALSELMDLRSARLDVVLSLIRELRKAEGVHIILSCREFEFRHDLRLSALNATPVRMTDPSWGDVSGLLAAAGLDADQWPEHARQLLRRPQYLNFFVSHFAKIRPTPTFVSYHAMIEAVLQNSLVKALGPMGLDALEQVAAAMAEDEELWVASARFERDFGPALRRLAALDLVVFDETGSKLAFRHQTLFDFVRARAFASRTISLSQHVLSRQDALFVRPTLWSTLHYLRNADGAAYTKEFGLLWSAPNLRRHIRYLMVEFLGQLADPSVVEAAWFLPLLDESASRTRALRAMQGGAEWFRRAQSRFSALMTESEEAAWQFSILLQRALEVTFEAAISAVEHHWIPEAKWDAFTLSSFHQFKNWDERSVSLVEKVVRRSPILNAGAVEHIAGVISKSCPDLAARVVAARLWAELEHAEREPVILPAPPPPDAPESDHVVYQIRKSDAHYRAVKKIVEDNRTWYGLVDLSSVAPRPFVELILPWVLHVARKYSRDGRNLCDCYRGDEIFEIPSSRHRHQYDFMQALVAGIKGFATSDPTAFLALVARLEASDFLIIHQLIAEGLESLGATRPQAALKYLLGDKRRLALDSRWGNRETRKLIAAIIPALDGSDRLLLEQTILGWTFYTRTAQLDVKERRDCYRWNREHRISLLRAFPLDTLSPRGRRYLEKEARALPYFLSDSGPEVTGGIIRSPMSAEQMKSAKDEDILNLFENLTDDKEWGHSLSLKGGSMEASRAFGEFAKLEPHRALRIIARLQPDRQERPVAEGTAGMAEAGALAPEQILQLVEALDSRGFKSDEFRQRVSWALVKIASKIGGLNDETCSLLEGWLRDETSPHGLGVREVAGSPRCFLGDSHRSRILPHGNYPILQSLFVGFLARKPHAADRWLSVLERHFERRKESPDVWAALLFHEMFWLRHSDRLRSSSLVTRLFERHPELLTSEVAPYFLGANHHWLPPEFTHSCLHEWENGSWGEGPQAAAEVCMYRYASVPDDDRCARMIERILLGQVSDPDRLAGMRVGLAFAFRELWSYPSTRDRVTPILLRFIPLANGKAAAAVMDIFRFSDPLPVDAATRQVLDCLVECPSVLSQVGSSFLIDRLKDLLSDGNEARRVCDVTSAILRANTASDFRTALSHAADDLVHIALTLQRLPQTRSAGLQLFEDLMEMDVYSVATTLGELDRRLPSNQN
jgi:hypothetical protein